MILQRSIQVLKTELNKYFYHYSLVKKPFYDFLKMSSLFSAEDYITEAPCNPSRGHREREQQYPASDSHEAGPTGLEDVKDILQPLHPAIINK